MWCECDDVEIVCDAVVVVVCVVCPDSVPVVTIVFLDGCAKVWSVCFGETAVLG